MIELNFSARHELAAYSADTAITRENLVSHLLGYVSAVAIEYDRGRLRAGTLMRIEPRAEGRQANQTSRSVYADPPCITHEL